MFDNRCKCFTIITDCWKHCVTQVFVFFGQFIFEGMEESGSDGLDDLVFAKKDTFLKVWHHKVTNKIVSFINPHSGTTITSHMPQLRSENIIHVSCRSWTQDLWSRILVGLSPSYWHQIFKIHTPEYGDTSLPR